MKFFPPQALFQLRTLDHILERVCMRETERERERMDAFSTNIAFFNIFFSFVI